MQESSRYSGPRISTSMTRSLLEIDESLWLPLAWAFSNSQSWPKIDQKEEKSRESPRLDTHSKPSVNLVDAKKSSSSDLLLNKSEEPPKHPLSGYLCTFLKLLLFFFDDAGVKRADWANQLSRRSYKDNQGSRASLISKLEHRLWALVTSGQIGVNKHVAKRVLRKLAGTQKHTTTY